MGRVSAVTRAKILGHAAIDRRHRRIDGYIYISVREFSMLTRLERKGGMPQCLPCTRAPRNIRHVSMLPGQRRGPASYGHAQTEEGLALTKIGGGSPLYDFSLRKKISDMPEPATPRRQAQVGKAGV